MNVPLPGVTVDPQGVSTSVAITDSHGNTPTAYSDHYGINTVALPDTITARTTFFLPGEGPWTITPTASGQITKATTLTLEDGQVATVTVGSVFDASQWEQFGAYVTPNPAGGAKQLPFLLVTGPSGSAATDTANIQAALNAANTLGAAKVILSATVGTNPYLTDAELVIHANTSLQGQGKFSTYVKAAAAFPVNSYVIVNYAQTQGVGNDAGIELSDLTFDLNGANQAASQAICPAFTRTTDLVFRRLHIINPYGFAGLINGASGADAFTYNIRPRMEDCLVDGTGQIGAYDLFDFGNSTNGVVSNCHFIGGNGFSTALTKGCRYEGVVTENSNIGFGMEGLVNATFTDCHVYTPSNDGFVLSQWSEDANVQACLNVTFNGCSANGSSGGNGYHLYDSQGTNALPIVGLYLNGCAAVGNHLSGFVVSGVVGLVVNGGYCQNNSQSGVGAAVAFTLLNQGSETTAAANVDCIITGMSFFDTQPTPTQTYGLDINQAANVLVSGCPFAQTTGAAIRFNPINSAPALSNVVVRNCPGFNPVGTITVAIPASGTALGPYNYDTTHYVTAAAGGCTLAIQAGPSPVVPALAMGTVRLPAGRTLTPTYTTAPSAWLAEGD